MIKLKDKLWPSLVLFQIRSVHNLQVYETYICLYVLARCIENRTKTFAALGNSLNALWLMGAKPMLQFQGASVDVFMAYFLDCQCEIVSLITFKTQPPSFEYYFSP